MAMRALFETVTRDGSEVTFAVDDLHDGSCFIVRDGVVEESMPADDAGTDRALKRFFRLIERRGGARHPLEAQTPQHAY